MVVYADDLDNECQLFLDKPEWLYRNGIRLTETATGYGKKLTTDFKIKFMGRNYRIYTTVYSNNGSNWFQCKKYGKVFIRNCRLDWGKIYLVGGLV